MELGVFETRFCPTNCWILTTGPCFSRQPPQGFLCVFMVDPYNKSQSSAVDSQKVVDDECGVVTRRAPRRGARTHGVRRIRMEAFPFFFARTSGADGDGVLVLLRVRAR
jgi:hypothetical protein